MPTAYVIVCVGKTMRVSNLGITKPQRVPALWGFFSVKVESSFQASYQLLVPI